MRELGDGASYGKTFSPGEQRPPMADLGGFGLRLGWEPFGDHRTASVDARHVQLSRTAVGEAVAFAGLGNDEVGGCRIDGVGVDGESNVAGLDDEHLAVGMTVRLWAVAGIGVNEER